MVAGVIMTLHEAAHLGVEINKMLVAQAVPPRLQIAILGGALACALMALPRRARKAALEVHATGLAETIDECGETYDYDG
jgi:hypothetical protein